MKNTLYLWKMPFILYAHINLQWPYCVIIILILQMRTSNLKEFISQYRVGYAAVTNTSRDLKHKIDLSLICPRCCLSETYSEQLFSKRWLKDQATSILMSRICDFQDFSDRRREYWRAMRNLFTACLFIQNWCIPFPLTFSWLKIIK